MKATALLVNALLVAGGILVYDLLRKEPERTSEAVEAVAPRAPAPGPTADMSPRLEGDALGDALRRIGSLEQRLREAENRLLAGGGPAGVVDGSGRSAEPTGPGGRPVELRGYEVPSVGDPDRPSFAPHVVKDFRNLLEEVERQRQEERRMEMVRNQLSRLDLRLTPDQERSVIAENLRYRDRLTEAFRNLGREPADRGQREATMETLKADYAAALKQVVSEDDAEKILAATARLPGGGGRRDPRVRGPGEEEVTFPVR
jgi:hypothetical protein